MTPIIIRAAHAQDDGIIRAKVRAAHLNPLGLHWSRFLVAEELHSGSVIGVGQIRIHRDGAQELASLVVDASYQGRGIGAVMVNTLLRRAAGELYLFCRVGMGPYYTRFGFIEVQACDLPGSLAWRLRVGQFFTGLVAPFSPAPIGVIAMRRALRRA